MNPGDVLPLPLRDVFGILKVRPSVLLAPLPGPYQTLPACGFSTQLQSIRADWDELMRPGDPDFPSSGLRQTSVVSLSYLYAGRDQEVRSVIGRIDPARLARLRQRLSDHLCPDAVPRHAPFPP